jgi:choline transport protein
MFWTIVLNGVSAYAFILVILFTMGSVEDALASPTGLPILAIFESVTGSRHVATAMGCGLIVISFSVNIACVASTSRLTWAWARDRALPDMFSIV